MIDVRSALQELRRLRTWIQQRMEGLHESYNQAAYRTRLHLRPWRRTRESPPYAVYWILLHRRRFDRRSWLTKQPHFPFRRVKIGTRQDLDDAIYHGMASGFRRTIYQFHGKATALNAANAAISRAVDGLRKLLFGFRTHDDLPADSLTRAEVLVGAFEWALDGARAELLKLELESKLFDALPLRLAYEQDAHHPYGRLRWRWVRDGRPEQPLTDRRKRLLGLPKDERRLLTPLELRRRQGMNSLLRVSKVARRIRARILPVPDQVRSLLEAQGIPIPRREAA